VNRGFLTGRNEDPWERTRLRALRDEIGWGRVAIGATLVALAGFLVDAVVRLYNLGVAGRWEVIVEILLGACIVCFFLLSALVYQITRLGYLRRLATHRPVPAHALDRAFDGRSPRLAILVPPGHTAGARGNGGEGRPPGSFPPPPPLRAVPGRGVAWVAVRAGPVVGGPIVAD